MVEKAVFLPPPELRRGPRGNQDDKNYVSKSKALVESIIELLSKNEPDISVGKQTLVNKSILDIGCGPLRLITGLKALGIDYGSYAGVDVDRDVIEWACQQVADEHHQFHCMDMENSRYNPQGVKVSNIHLPFTDSHFDLAVLRSVFTHMEMNDIELYLGEIARKLRPQGKVYLSIYVSDKAELRARNFSEYNASPETGPLHMQMVSKQWFENMLRKNGMEVLSFHPAVMFQPTYLIEKC
jgi:SAM-dependent methyltransferase